MKSLLLFFIIILSLYISAAQASDGPAVSSNFISPQEENHKALSPYPGLEEYMSFMDEIEVYLQSDEFIREVILSVEEKLEEKDSTSSPVELIENCVDARVFSVGEKHGIDSDDKVKALEAKILEEPGVKEKIDEVQDAAIDALYNLYTNEELQALFDENEKQEILEAAEMMKSMREFIRKD